MPCALAHEARNAIHRVRHGAGLVWKSSPGGFCIGVSKPGCTPPDGFHGLGRQSKRLGLDCHRGIWHREWVDPNQTLPEVWAFITEARTTGMSLSVMGCIQGFRFRAAST